MALAADGRDKLAQRSDGRRARLADLLNTLSSEDEFSLTLAAQVALPILRRLNENASTADTGRLSAIEAYCAEQASSLEQVQGGKS